MNMTQENELLYLDKLAEAMKENARLLNAIASQVTELNGEAIDSISAGAKKWTLIGKIETINCMLEVVAVRMEMK